MKISKENVQKSMIFRFNLNLEIFLLYLISLFIIAFIEKN